MTSQTTEAKQAALHAKIVDADARGSRWLGDANEAAEAGKKERAERLYEKGQYWMDRSNKLRDDLWVLRGKK